MNTHSTAVRQLPSPSHEQAEEVNDTRRRLSFVLGVAHHRDPDACDLAHRDYSAACRDAGVRRPIPWREWPSTTPIAARKPRAHTPPADPRPDTEKENP